MKKSNDILALVALGAVLLLRRRQSTAADSPAVGRVRRNIFAEIEWLQQHETPLNRAWESLSEFQQRMVWTAMYRSGYRQPSRAAANGEKPEESYYKALSRQYLKLVNPAIGRIQYPHTTSVIRNSRGDVVLTYNDYDPEKDMEAALDWFAEERDPYLRTIYAIARGNKWIWKGKKSGGQLLTRGLADELFFSRTNLEGERKLYKALIDNRNGWTVDKFVEEYLGDVPNAKDGALNALLSYPTPKAAKQFILESYYKTFDDGLQEDPDDIDLPF